MNRKTIKPGVFLGFGRLLLGVKALTDYPGLNYLDEQSEKIEQNEFKAFQYAVDDRVDFIMNEHTAVPSV
jgi:hypothetical protein